MDEDGLMWYQGACAACRHQRKRCDENCQLAQYFPMNKYEDFKTVQRLFGVNNLLKILSSVPDHLKAKTVETLISEANMRWDYPVHGSGMLEAELRRLIGAFEQELDVVNKHLSYVKGTQMLGQNECSSGFLPTNLAQNEPSMLSQAEGQFGTSFDASYYHQALTALETQNGAMYNYQSTLEEVAYIKKSFDVQPVDEMMGSYQYEIVLSNSAEPGESRLAFDDCGKQPIVIFKDEVGEGEDDPKINKGKQIMSTKIERN